MGGRGLPTTTLLVVMVVVMAGCSHSVPQPRQDPLVEAGGGEGERSSPAVVVGVAAEVGGGGRAVTRRRRQVEAEGDDATCDFGSDPDVTLCDWRNLPVTQLEWVASQGNNAFWVGGPQMDVTYGDGKGGYVMFETSQIPERVPGKPSFGSAMLMSAPKESTGAQGTCVLFSYSISGLSPDRLRVLLHPMAAVENNSADDTNTKDTGDGVPDGIRNDLDGLRGTRPTGTQKAMEDYDGSDDVVLWEARHLTEDEWKQAQVVYTYAHPHSIIFEGIPVDSGDISRRFRGYIAVDDLTFAESSQCGAFCTFEGGICDWTQDTNDVFDWKLSRGSKNPSTGPPRDRSSFANDGLNGGYAYIDSNYPRRPGDTARLMSQEFQQTDPDQPLCMRFWTHMFGNGIGTLRVIIFDMNAAKDKVIWTISGEAGNAWYQGQVPIASPTPFKIVFEGVVGRNNLGDIAIDDISIIQGACPSAPQVAAGNNGDCTFEVDECGWVNPGPREGLDDVDWFRTAAVDNRAPPRDHTIGTIQGFYVTLPRGAVQRGGDRAWLVSPTMKGSSDPMCVAFWYYMYEPFIEPSGPSLGSLLVYTRYQDAAGNLAMVPVWSLKNHQGPSWLYGQARVQSEQDYVVVFEGVWGSSRGSGFMALDDITLFVGDCSTMPEKAMVSVGDCDFLQGTCDWKNITSDRDFRWTAASISRRPANLPDRTFGGPVGYVYFDVFNQAGSPQTLSLLAPPSASTEDSQPVCFTFWYSSFGASDTTKLKVVREAYDRTADEGQEFSDPRELWVVAAQPGSQRPEWKFGQAQVDASSEYRISLVGMATNGGFAVDDVVTYPGACPLRPKEADPSKQDNDEN